MIFLSHLIQKILEFLAVLEKNFEFTNKIEERRLDREASTTLSKPNGEIFSDLKVRVKVKMFHVHIYKAYKFYADLVAIMRIILPTNVNNINLELISWSLPPFRDLKLRVQIIMSLRIRNTHPQNFSSTYLTRRNFHECKV